MAKGIQHFKDFEIQQALTIFLALEQDSSLSAQQRAKASLYAGMSYAYLRKQPEAVKHFQKALQQDSNVQLPADAPARLKKLFEEAKQSAGSSSSSGRTTPPPVRDSSPSLPEPRRETPPEPRVDPPVDIDNPPVRRTTQPPPRRRFDFGNFSMSRPRPRPPVRTSEPDTLPPARRKPDTSPMLDLPPERRVDTPPPERRRRVAQIPPDSDIGTPGISAQTKPIRGPNPLWIGAWVAAGAAVAMVGVGIAMGSLASIQAGQAAQPTAYQIDVPLIEQDANRSALIANVMYIGAGVAAATAVVLFILHPRANPKPPQNSPDGLTQSKPIAPPTALVPPHIATFSIYETP